MTNILVLGGAGYVGSSACKALSRAGHRPVTYDNLTTGHRDFVRWGPLVEGDIRDTARLAATMRDWQVEAVMHFAAAAYVGESVANPGKYYSNNVLGTLSVLEAMRETGLRRLVFSSTCAIFGQPDRLLVDEQTAKNPESPYGRTKLVCEQMMTDFDRAHGIKSFALRYFNAAGASLDAEVGELRDPETHLIPRALMHLLGHCDDFEVFGDDFPTPDGTAIRDYVHVADLADAHVAAVRLLLDGAASTAVNLGSGVGYSVREVLAAVSAVTGRPLDPVYGPRRSGDVQSLVASNGYARSTLGFDPRRSDINTIVSSAWAWHQLAHPDRTAALPRRRRAL